MEMRCKFLLIKEIVSIVSIALQASIYAISIRLLTVALAYLVRGATELEKEIFELPLEQIIVLWHPLKR